MIGDQPFWDVPQGMEPHRVCSHFRHVVEFYECFLEGLRDSLVDYSARKRDPRLEGSRAICAERICGIIRGLDTHPALHTEGWVRVRMEDEAGVELEDPYMMSSVSRELMMLSSHTIHHFALIGVTLRAHGVEVDADFGMAVSTLQYRKQKMTSAL